jgi:hypothetical protein
VRDIVGIDQNGDVSHMRRDLLKHPKQFRSQARLHHRKSRHVAPRVGKALHNAVSYQIAPAYEYDGNRLGRLLCRLYCRITVRQQHIR